MKKIVLIACMIISGLPIAFAVNTGSSIGAKICVEDFVPRVWMCDSRVVLDNAEEPGRISEDGKQLLERTQNYAFEGEQIQWDVLVMDKNGIQKVSDVHVLTKDVKHGYPDIEANCVENLYGKRDIRSCNARILEEEITQFNGKTMRFYTCTLTVETPLSMYGGHAFTVEAEDSNTNVGRMDEIEYWFLNPEVALSIEGEVQFENVRPGTQSYSPAIFVGNKADERSGVQLDMFISGTDFYSSTGRRGTCPDTNQLRLGDGESDCDPNDPFCYFASSGSFDTTSDLRNDAEGYVGINYGVGFNDPNPFYGLFNGDVNGHEILQGAQVGSYFPSNILNPASEMTLTFRLNLPKPCNGKYDSGKIFFWAEAI